MPIKKLQSCISVPFVAAFCLCGALHAQGSVTAHLTQTSPDKKVGISAVFWLEPLGGTAAPPLPWKHSGPYRLVQKNKMFSPHLLVVPVGTTVIFPNDDPFFHNVFSLFDGKRFDLGLYEAGTSKEVRFERPGISYLFCNIHPQMSAIVVALQTPFFTTAQADGTLSIQSVPMGEYSAHLWVEGADEHALASWIHRISVREAHVEAGNFAVDALRSERHFDKFGKPYKPDVPSY